jgi:hypothetical protein
VYDLEIDLSARATPPPYGRAKSAGQRYWLAEQNLLADITAAFE